MHLRQAHGGETGTLIEDPSQNLPQSQLPGEIMAERGIDAPPARHLVEGPYRADREALPELDVIEGAQCGEVPFELEGQLNGGDFLGVAMGEIGDVAFADVRAVAVRLAEID